MTELTREGSAVSLPTERAGIFDPALEIRTFREEEPLRRLRFPDGHVGWIATSYALVRNIAIDSRFSSRSEFQRRALDIGGGAFFGQPAPPGMFIFMDPPEHTRYRRLVRGYFSLRRLAELAERVEKIVDDQLDAMEDAGPPLDLVTAFALPIPSLVISQILGVPHADHDQFQHCATTLLDPASTVEQARVAHESLIAYLKGLIRTKRATPADDLLSQLASSGLRDEELAGVASLLLNAGHETTSNMLALGTFALLSHPEQLERLRRSPALIDSAIEELLRYLSIFHVGVTRAALTDVEIAGQTIRAGETILLSIVGANRDPQRFADPDALDIERSASGQVAFGHGIHACIGQHLARLEMRHAYPALFGRFPTLRLATDPEDVPLRTNWLVFGVRELRLTW